MSVDDAILDEDLLIPAEKDKSNSSLNQQLHHSTGSISKLSTAPVPVIDLLKYTVNLLKAIPIGKIVRLGVQKPLPYPDAADSQEERMIDGGNNDENTMPTKQTRLKASKSSQSYHNLYHTKTAGTMSSSTNTTPVAKKRKQNRPKLTKKKVTQKNPRNL